MTDVPAEYRPWLERVQNDLFDVGADIAAPEEHRPPPLHTPGRPKDRLRVIPEQTAWLEERCDEVNARLEPLHSFVLPGGDAAAASSCTCAGPCCRRAERLAIACGPEVNAEAVRYLNRLSATCCSSSRAEPIAARSRCGSRVATETRITSISPVARASASTAIATAPITNA